MKIEANKLVSVKCQAKVDFKLGKKLHLEMSNGSQFTIIEKDDRVVVEMNKPYVTYLKNDNQLIISNELKSKRRVNSKGKPIVNIKNYLNWSEISRLLVGNSSTITKNQISNKNAARVQDLLDFVNEWVEKNS